MLHTVKTTCAISALLVSFAASAHAANVVSDPYASYIDCSYSQAKSSGNSGCTVRGQQVTVSALSQMMAAANAYNYNAIANYNYNVTLDANNQAYNGGEEMGNARYERGMERGVDGKDREVKKLIFFVDDLPKDKEGKTVTRRREVNSGQPGLVERERRAYKIELSDEAAARIEKVIPRKKEKDDGISISLQPRRAEARDAKMKDSASTDRIEVAMPLAYASPAEIKAEEEKIMKTVAGAPAVATSTVVLAKPERAKADTDANQTTATAVTAGTIVEARPARAKAETDANQATATAVTVGTVVEARPARAKAETDANQTTATAVTADTIVEARPARAKAETDANQATATAVTVTSVKPATAEQSGDTMTIKVMLVPNKAETTGDLTYTIRVYNASTAETIYSVRVLADTAVSYNVRTVLVPVTQSLAQGGTSATPGENVRDQINSGSTNTSPLGGAPAEPMDKDGPDSGKGGLGTFK